MPFGERQKREIAAAQRRLGVGDDGAQTGNAPPCAHECRGCRMLPALELRYAKRDDVRIEERAATLQCGEQLPVDFRERRLERLSVGAACERERLPSPLPQVHVTPRCFQRGGVAGGEQSPECRRKSAQPPNGIHVLNVESAWILRYPIRSLNLARSCAGAGLSSSRFCRSPLAPVEAAETPLSSAFQGRSHNPAESRCVTPRSWRSRKSMPGAESGAAGWHCASWTTAAVPTSPFALRSSWQMIPRSSPLLVISTRAPRSRRGRGVGRPLPPGGWFSPGALGP